LYCIFSPNEYLCGHPEIQHGGATATIIDQNLGVLTVLNSKSSVATVDLHIKYKRPIKKDQFYVLEGRVIEKIGRKIKVKGIIK
jgi:acyl-coenzyme A thioesterase PaaI-like protein